MHQVLNDDFCCQSDIKKKVKLSDLEIGLPLASPASAKRKICLALLAHLNSICLDELYGQTHL